MLKPPVSMSFYESLEGIEDALYDVGYDITLCITREFDGYYKALSDSVIDSNTKLVQVVGLGCMKKCARYHM